LCYDLLSNAPGRAAFTMNIYEDLHSSHYRVTAESIGVCCGQERYPVTHAHFRIFEDVLSCLKGMTDVELAWFQNKETDPSCVTFGHWQIRRFYNKTAHYHWTVFGSLLEVGLRTARPMCFVREALEEYYEKKDMRWLSLLVSGDIRCPDKPIAIDTDPLMMAVDINGLVEVQYDLPFFPAAEAEIHPDGVITGPILTSDTISMHDIPASAEIAEVEDGGHYTFDCSSVSYFGNGPSERYTYNLAAPDSNVVRESICFSEFEGKKSSVSRKNFGLEIQVPTKMGDVSIPTPYITQAQRRYLSSVEAYDIAPALVLPLASEYDGTLVAKLEGAYLMSYHPKSGRALICSYNMEHESVCTCMLQALVPPGSTYKRYPCMLHGFRWKWKEYTIGWKMIADIQVTSFRYRTVTTLGFRPSKKMVGHNYGHFSFRTDGTPADKHPAHFPFIPIFNGFNLSYAGRTMSMSVGEIQGFLALRLSGYSYRSGIKGVFLDLMAIATGLPHELMKGIFLYLLYFELFLPCIPHKSQRAGRWKPQVMMDVDAYGWDDPS